LARQRRAVRAATRRRVSLRLHAVLVILIAPYSLYNASRFGFGDYRRDRAKEVRVRTRPVQGETKDATLFDYLNFKRIHNVLSRPGYSSLVELFGRDASSSMAPLRSSRHRLK
jgi:hypothetical protein